MTLSSRNPREQSVLTKQNRCLCAQCHPNVSSHVPILFINHVVLVCRLQFLFWSNISISAAFRGMCDRMCDKTKCVTAGLFRIYAVRFHHLFQRLLIQREDLLLLRQLLPVCPWARPLTSLCCMITKDWEDWAWVWLSLRHWLHVKYSWRGKKEHITW